MVGTSRRRVANALAAALIALVPTAALAVDYTWNGGGADNNWSTAANWISGTAPVSGTANNLIFAGSTRLSPVNDLAANSAFLAIQFSAGAGNFSLSGNAIRLGDYSTASNVITNSGSNLSLTIDNAIAFNEALPAVLAGSSGNTLTLNGLLTNGTGSAITEFRVSQGLVNFTNSANSMSGVFAVFGSATAVFSNIANGGVASAVGSGTSFRLGNAGNPGTLRYTGGTISTDRRMTFGSNSGAAAGGGTIQADGSGAITFSNAAFNFSPGTTSDTTRTVTLSGSNTADNTISGTIIDNDTDAPIAITKSGVGRWVLAGNSTYTGATTVSAGTLVIAHANALGSTAAGTTVSANAALGLQGDITTANEALTISGTGVSGDGALLNVSGINTYSGAVTLGANATVGATSGTLTLASAVGGGFNLSKAGAGTVVLSAANTFSGTATVSAGVLRATSSASALGSGTLALGGGNLELANDTGLAFGRDTVVSTSGTIFSERLTAGAGVTHTLGTLSIGAQTLTLDKDASVTSGVAGLTFGNVTQTGVATLAANAGTLLTTGTVGGAFNFTVGGAGDTSVAGFVPGGSQTLTKTGAGTLTLSATSNHTGLTAVSGGTLAYGVADALGTGNVTINGGVLNLSTFSDSVGTVALTSGNIIGSGTLTSTATYNLSSGTVSAPLAGSVGLTKSGNGTVVLSASNSYAGLTTVSGGVLQLGANQTSATSSVTVTSGTLDLNGYTMNLQSVVSNKGLQLGGGAAGTRAFVSTGSGTMVIQSVGVFPWISYDSTNNPLGAEVAGNLRILSGGGFTGFMADDSTATDEDLTISAVVSGTLNTVYSQTPGTVVFTGLNTYAADGFQLRGGTWVLGTNALLNQPGALGNNAINTVNVGHITQQQNATLLLREGVTTDRRMVITTNTAGPFTFTRTIGGTFTSGTATFSGGMTVNTNARLTAAAGGTVVLGGSIINGATNLQSGTISKVGLGTFVVTGSNSTTFPWLVEQGTLIVNGTNSGGGLFTVNAGAILGGSGQIGSQVNVAGTLSPGNSPGLLTLASLALESTATTLMEIEGTARGSQYDGIDITTAGGLTYDGLLSITFGIGSAVADNTTFDLFSFTGSPSGNLTSVTSSGFYAGTWQTAGSGTWQLQQGSQTLTFSQATGDVIIVPEPGTLAMLAAGAAGLAAALRRRRA